MNKTSFQLSNFGLLFVFTMTSVGSGSYEFAKFVSNHIFSYIYRNMLAAVMNCNCVSNEGRENCRTTDQVLITCFCPAAFIASTFSASWHQRTVLFFSDLAIVVLLLNLI